MSPAQQQGQLCPLHHADTTAPDPGYVMEAGGGACAAPLHAAQNSVYHWWHISAKAARLILAGEQ